jgi:hypothetical protein
MVTRKTNDEKLRLISDHEASGLSKVEWCTANGISTSTFAGWIRSTKTNVTKPKNEARFVEVTFLTKWQEKNTADITVEYKSINITISANVYIRTLENTFKVVLQSNV